MNIKGIVINLINKYLSLYDHRIVHRYDVRPEISRELRKKWVREFLLKQSETNIENILAIESDSKSQLHQDLFVLSELNFKTDGFFVEFGATNGVELSNTYLLEKEFGWNGILSEPAKRWQEQLKKNRNCSIESNCVWSRTGEELEFFGAEHGELSTINDYTESDVHVRTKNKVYKVQTISLLDMLKKHNAPKNIDFLSIDTEGSEFEILKNFDFDEYNIKIIAAEHNHTDMREKIFDLLTKHKYVRKYTEVSGCDDWYVRM